MPAISVCLPIYNGERYLAEAIESILAQTFADFELIVVDDCSTDSSASIVEALAARDPRIKFARNEHNLGLFANYNRCIELCSSPIIKLFAQDDVLRPLMLETVKQVFDEHPDAAMVSTGKQWISDDGSVLKTFQLFPKRTQITGTELIRYNLMQLSNWAGEPSCVAFRTKYKGTGFNTTLFHYGDIEYWFRVAEQGAFIYTPETLCGFRRHAGSATSKNLKGLYFALDILQLGKTYRRYLAEIGESEEHFKKRAMETIAINIDHLVRNERATAQTCIDARPSQMPIDEASAFKELSFEASRMITSLLENISALEHQMADQKRYYEAQLEDMRNSTSWKLTAPVRKIASMKGR